jgi:hypothetical protein
MPRNILLASALALLLAGQAAIAQDAPPPAGHGPGPAPAGGPDGRGGPPLDGGHGLPFPPPAGAEAGRFGGPGAGIVADLRELERLYREAGRSKELPALYQEVLAKSQDPGVRDYAYHQLARAQAQPANVDQAIATLRKSLEENLAGAARQQAELEQRHERWQQHGNDPAPTAR